MLLARGIGFGKGVGISWLDGSAGHFIKWDMF